LIPVALEQVQEALKDEVEHLAGARYAREGRRLGHVRWTSQRGSVYLADQKIAIEVPRVRDRVRNQEVPLETYQRLQQPRAMDTGLLHKILGGLSTREYERCAEAVPEAFGLSASTVSRRFKRASGRKLRELMERRLEAYDLVALLLDGKTFAEDEMVTAIGVTITGEKVLLGFVQTATENRKVCAAFLRELIERGLQIEAGLLGPPPCSSAVNGTNARTSCSTYPIGIGRRYGANCRRRMSSRPTRPRNAPWGNCEPNLCSSMPPRPRVWTKGWKRP
jgi:transposase-like protein